MRRRSRCALPLVAAALLAVWHPAAAGPRGCALPAGMVVTQQARLRLAGQSVTVATLAISDPNDERSRLLVLDGRCRPIWSLTVDGAESRFDVRRLGGTELLQFVTLQAYGDGTGYVHRLLTLDGSRLTLALPPIQHFGKDGFYLGQLSGGGAGIVTWSADPTGESEADAHPYVITQWRWLGHRFAPPMSHETTAKYLAPETPSPRADAVARAMKLPYRDQTGLNRFTKTTD